MVLNNHSFVHKKIKILCFKLEQLSGLKLVTKLTNEMTQIKFLSTYAHITIDYKNHAIFVLNHKITGQEMQTIEDIITYSNWLEIGEKYSVTKM